MPYVRPTKLRSGALLQSGVPKQSKSLPEPYHGILRGVVTATYRVDDPNHPLVPLGITPTAVWCDVLAVGNFQGGSRYFFLPGCQVCQPFGGMHKGFVFVPKATTRLTSGQSLSSVTPQDVNQMDGDWVLIQCLDGRTNQPVIVGTLPHPSRDVGVSPDAPPGQRQGLRLVDGEPNFLSHHGSFFGIDTDGNFAVNTTSANSGQLTPQGSQLPTQPGQGNVEVTVPTGASVSVKASSGDILSLQGVAVGASLVLGDGSAHVALAEPFELWWSSLVIPYLKLATGSPIPPPPYSPAITSGAVRVPVRPA